MQPVFSYVFGTSTVGIRAALGRSMLMNSRTPRKMTCHCGWCGAVRRPDGTWNDEFDSDVSQQAHISRHNPELVTHGICPDCAAAFRADAAIGRRQQPRAEEPFEPRAASAYLMASF
jgi:hypothetical protein